MFSSVGFYGIYSNYTTGDCSIAVANCDENNPINWISIPNKILHPGEYQIQSWINLGTALVIMISLHLFRRIQKRTEINSDISVNSPSDYSVWLSGLPKGKFTEEEIRDMFGKDYVIKKVVMAYYIFDFAKNCKEITKTEKKIRELEAELEKPNKKQLEKLKLQLYKLEDENNKNKDGGTLRKTTGDVSLFSKNKTVIIFFNLKK